MIYKHLFFFFSYLEKKCKTQGDPYISAYIFIGFTLSINLFVVGDIMCIFVMRDAFFADKWTKAMYFIGFAMVIFSYFYFRHDNRRDKIYDEIHQSARCKKIRYGIYCLLYVVFSYGLWFVCNDIMCVLRNGSGLLYAEGIVETLKLTYW